MDIVRSKEAIFNYLIEPSHLFLKQVVNIAETNAYILVMDLRKSKKRSIPDTVINKYENRLANLRRYGYRFNEYDGVNYLIISK